MLPTPLNFEHDLQLRRDLGRCKDFRETYRRSDPMLRRRQPNELFDPLRMWAQFQPWSVVRALFSYGHCQGGPRCRHPTDDLPAHALRKLFHKAHREARAERALTREADVGRGSYRETTLSQVSVRLGQPAFAFT